jgi:hypothetical protein
MVVAMKKGEKPGIIKTTTTMFRNEGLKSFAKGMGPSSFKGAVSGTCFVDLNYVLKCPSLFPSMCSLFLFLRLGRCWF